MIIGFRRFVEQRIETKKNAKKNGHTPSMFLCGPFFSSIHACGSMAIRFCAAFFFSHSLCRRLLLRVFSAADILAVRNELLYTFSQFRFFRRIKLEKTTIMIIDENSRIDSCLDDYSFILIVFFFVLFFVVFTLRLVFLSLPLRSTWETKRISYEDP